MDAEQPVPIPGPATDPRRDIAGEAGLIAQADASVAAGRVVDEMAVDAWIDSIGTDRELPVPYSRPPSLRR